MLTFCPVYLPTTQVLPQTRQNLPPLRRTKVSRTTRVLRATLEPYDAVTPPAPVIAGAIALAIPFFVAAVLFGERIIRQRNCDTCKGSGLIQEENTFYKRCPE